MVIVGNLWILRIAQEKLKEYGISIEGEWDVELLKSELEEQLSIITARTNNLDL